MPLPLGKNSQWSQYMFSRYFKEDHPSTVSLSPNSSLVWKRLWMVRDDVEQHLFWIQGGGEIDISLHKWPKHDIPVMNDRVAVKSIFQTEKEVDISLAKRILGIHICDVINKENITLSNSEDKLYWAHIQALNNSQYSQLGIVLDKEDLDHPLHSKISGTRTDP